MSCRPIAMPAAPHLRVAGGFAALATRVRRHDATGRAPLAASRPFHRATAACMIEGVA